MIIVGAIAIICLTSLALLAMWLHHLHGMRVTDGEVADINECVSKDKEEISAELAVLHGRIKAAEDKITLLSNRLQTTR